MMRLIVLLAAYGAFANSEILAISESPLEHHEESQQVITSGISEDGKPKSSSYSSSISFGPEGVKHSGHVWDGEHGKVWGEAGKEAKENEEEFLTDKAGDQRAKEMHERMTQGSLTATDVHPRVARMLDDLTKDLFEPLAPAVPAKKAVKKEELVAKEPECDNVLCHAGNWVKNLFSSDKGKKDESEPAWCCGDESTDDKKDPALVAEPADSKIMESVTPGHSVSMSWNNGKFGATINDGHGGTRTYGTHRNMTKSLVEGKKVKSKPQSFLSAA